MDTTSNTMSANKGTVSPDLDVFTLVEENQRLTRLVASLQAERDALLVENRTLKLRHETSVTSDQSLLNTHRPFRGGEECHPMTEESLQHRKQLLESEMGAARKIISDAEAIRSQLDELERMTDRLAKENQQLRALREGTGNDPATPPADSPGGYNGLSMIRPPRTQGVEARKMALQEDEGEKKNLKLAGSSEKAPVEEKQPPPATSKRGLLGTAFFQALRKQ